MRRAARVDANQAEIVEALRAIGCSVQTLHQVGSGVPDLMVGVRGVNLLLEVKDGNKPPSRRQLTPAEATWHNEWRGQVSIVESIDDAIKLVEGITK